MALKIRYIVQNLKIPKFSKIGCGVVFANYNGTDKNKTVVGKNNFIGANVNLVAPLEIKDNCYIGAGTTVGDNIEA